MSNKKLTIAWLAVILWMALIFAFSAQPSGETNHLSVSVSQMILRNKAAASLGVSGSENAVTLFNFIIRHLAHFFLFFVLGLLVTNALRGIKVRVQGRRGFLRGFMLAAVICFAYAVSDEIHQMFVPGRDPDVKDVLIDAVGAVLGIMFYRIIQNRLQRLQRRSEKN